MVDFSVCTTTFNNVSRVRICLDSIIKAFDGLDYELVIVDNFSTDGTYEILKEYAQRYHNVKVFKFKCSRGLGRHVAFENSNGRYVVTIDADTEYDSEKIRKILIMYKEQKFGESVAVKFWGSLGLYPRSLIEKIDGWNDYNVAEDHDFWARISKTGSLKFLPINVEVNEPYEEWRKGPLTALRFSLIVRERRYSHGFKLISRILRNTIDEYCALGITTRKIVIRHAYLGIKIYKTFLGIILTFFSKCVIFFWGRPVTYANEDFDNAHYNYYFFIKNMVDPQKFGFKIESGPTFLDEHFRFIAKIKPDIKRELEYYFSKII